MVRDVFTSSLHRNEVTLKDKLIGAYTDHVTASWCTYCIAGVVCH